MHLTLKHLYAIFPEKRLIVQRYVGAFSLAELQASAERLWADSGYSPSYDVLSDLTSASIGLSAAEARRFAEFVNSHPRKGEGRLAAVLSSPTETALALLFQRLVSARAQMEVFCTWEAACAYLAVEVARLETPA